MIDMGLKARTLAVLMTTTVLAGCGSDGTAPEQAAAPPPLERSPAESAIEQGPAPSGDAAAEPQESHGPAASGARAVDASSNGAAPPAPPLEHMALARASGKIGVPVDVRYLVSGVIARDQPATVQLAFVPRVAGKNLQVQFPDTAGVTIETGAHDIRVQKAAAADVVRHSLLVTPTAGDSGEMRAIVSMELDGGRYFSIYTIPIGSPGQTGSKQPKQPPKG